MARWFRTQEDGMLDLDEVVAVVREETEHFAGTVMFKSGSSVRIGGLELMNLQERLGKEVKNEAK